MGSRWSPSDRGLKASGGPGTSKALTPQANLKEGAQVDPLATPSALGIWMGETLEDDDARALAVLDHASSLVRITARDTWLTTTPPDGIPQLVVRVAHRLWLNPGGLKSTSAGPFSGTFGDMELTDGERLEIDQIMHPGIRRGLGTISTTRAPWETESLVAVVGSDKGLPVSREPW